MSAPARWIAAAVAALLIIGMVIWARGDEHHRGDDVGSVATVLR